LTGGATTV